MITGVSASELEEVVWGFDQRAPFKSHTVASLVPPIFERYARIFHPAMHYGIAGAYDVSWRDVTMRTGRIAHALMNWDNITPTSSYFTTTLAEPVMGTLPDEVSLPLRGYSPLGQIFAVLGSGMDGVIPTHRTFLLLLRLIRVRRGSITCLLVP